MSLRWYIPALLLVPALLSGCGDDSPPQPDMTDGDVRIANQVHPFYENGLVTKANTANPSLTGDPLTGDDPMGTSTDPLTGGAQMGGGDDPLTHDDTGASSKVTRPIKNWYWLRGTIANGSVTVKVNGFTIGRFSVVVDKEISDYLQNGSNDVTFVCTPTVSSEPVSANMVVVYSQQDPGALPVLTFNTTETPDSSMTPAPVYTPPSPSALPTPTTATDRQAATTPGAGADPAPTPDITLPPTTPQAKATIPGLPLPSIDPPTDPDGSVTKTLSFVAS